MKPQKIQNWHILHEYKNGQEDIWPSNIEPEKLDQVTGNHPDICVARLNDNDLTRIIAWNAEYGPPRRIDVFKTNKEHIANKPYCTNAEIWNFKNDLIQFIYDYQKAVRGKKEPVEVNIIHNRITNDQLEQAYDLAEDDEDLKASMLYLLTKQANIDDSSDLVREIVDVWTPNLHDAQRGIVFYDYIEPNTVYRHIDGKWQRLNQYTYSLVTTQKFKTRSL